MLKPPYYFIFSIIKSITIPENAPKLKYENIIIKYTNNKLSCGKADNTTAFVTTVINQRKTPIADPMIVNILSPSCYLI
jgi:hypothetical protein